ncbi:MAG TPA: hypothetical protein DCP90_00040 [Clostridiales bacterium]|nr:MAG: hypothetical protein A2Y22_02645 [Clostridiales bacterium GWD2_32_59]HAN08984.1 hypothetical protein [Clostridiales bacterium]
MLKIENICKTYINKGDSCVANDNISLEVEKKDVVGILGSNGAGKTTLMKIVSNLVKQTSGKVYWDGLSLDEHKYIVKDKISILLEGTRNLYDFLTVEDNINYFALLNNVEGKSCKNRKDYLLKYFDLYEKKHTIVNNLSRGMKQKLALIVALLKKPELLILDEPTLGLDINSRFDITELIKKITHEMKITTLVCSHDLEFIKEISNKIAVFDKGKLIKYDYINNFIMKSSYLEYEILFKGDNGLEKIITNDLQKKLTEISIDKIIKIEQTGNSIEKYLEGLRKNG